MRKLLRIDADPQILTALVRDLADEYIDARKEAYPDIEVADRDLALEPVGHLANDEDVDALYAPPETHTVEMKQKAKYSDELINEFTSADEIVIATPMYNLTVPSILKAYIDQVVRARKTFRFTADGPHGLVGNKKMVIITVCGGIYSKGENKKLDFLHPYLKAIFQFVGIKDITFVRAEGLAIDPETREKAINQARKILLKLAKSSNF